MVRRNTLIILALFVVTLVAFLIYQNQKTGSPASTTDTGIPTALPPIFDFSADQLKSLSFSYATGQKVMFEKGADGKWMVKEPANSVFGPEAVESIVSQLGQLTPASTLSSAPSPDLVGLVNPVKSFTLVFASGKTLAVKIGDVAPTGNVYYIQINDDPVMVVNKYMLDGLETQVAQALVTATSEPGPEGPTIQPAETPAP
ncbi:MAG TPA: DUF4340 domain-containing protein [Anaerolineaceae bacterium]|nr:DUF4340 domain-containing protein [Anaerolineaceae bacterium]HPN50852.1 DUF4340 domain-containing protein [Anaerolineaceae bacterium]